VHVLYQNVLYASHKPARRASLSAAVAEAILCHYGEKKSSAVAARLAILFESAREFSPAVDYFLLAAQNAARIIAYTEEITLSHRGLAWIPTVKVCLTFRYRKSAGDPVFIGSLA